MYKHPLDYEKSPEPRKVEVTKIFPETYVNIYSDSHTGYDVGESCSRFGTMQEDTFIKGVLVPAGSRICYHD